MKKLSFIEIEGMDTAGESVRSVRPHFVLSLHSLFFARTQQELLFVVRQPPRQTAGGSGRLGRTFHHWSAAPARKVQQLSLLIRRQVISP